MRNLVALPSEVLGDPVVMAAANDFLGRRGEQNGALAGRTRESFATEATDPIST
jgi:hypothetical protein